MAAVIGERKRVEKRSAFDLEPPIAGHQSFTKRFGGRGAELLYAAYACFFMVHAAFFIAVVGRTLTSNNLARSKHSLSRPDDGASFA
jgi:hypothetical protein